MLATITGKLLSVCVLRLRISRYPLVICINKAHVFKIQDKHILALDQCGTKDRGSRSGTVPPGQLAPGIQRTYSPNEGDILRVHFFDFE